MKTTKLDGGIASNIVELIASYHQPELAKEESGHVYILFSDGEISMTKCGSLLSQRNLHMLELELEVYKKLPKAAWPAMHEGYDCIFCTRDQAYLLRKELECLI